MDIPATCKSLVAASEDNGAYVLVLLILFQSVIELNEQRARQSIQGSRTIQGDLLISAGNSSPKDPTYSSQHQAVEKKQ
jgi:hypothetical protein